MPATRDGEAGVFATTALPAEPVAGCDSVPLPHAARAPISSSARVTTASVDLDGLVEVRVAGIGARGHKKQAKQVATHEGAVNIPA